MCTHDGRSSHDSGTFSDSTIHQNPPALDAMSNDRATQPIAVVSHTSVSSADVLTRARLIDSTIQLSHAHREICDLRTRLEKAQKEIAFLTQDKERLEVALRKASCKLLWVDTRATQRTHHRRSEGGASELVDSTGTTDA